MDTFLRRWASWPGAIATLTLTNVVVFFRHWIGAAQFPADFPMSYYGFVAYWTTAVRHGVAPEWMPFQEMGYPFFANLQTGIAYPPFWIFPALDLDYTMHAAVIVGVLHVLAGAIGAYALGRRLFGPGAPALLLGVAFHFFGGFYANAQHADIVRSYALLPWLILAGHLEPGQTRLAARNLALPLLVSMNITGGYPGNTTSHLLLLGVYLLATYLPRSRPAWALLPMMLGAMILGIVLSAPMLGPGMSLQHNLVRSTGIRPEEMDWPLANWPYFFVPWRQHRIVADVSMVGEFLPVPAIALALLVRRARLRAMTPLLVVLGGALAMAPGQYSQIARLAYRVFPVLGLSRFPSSDYRAVIALVVLLIGAASLADLLDESTRIRWEEAQRRLLLLAVVFAFLVTGQAGVRTIVLDLVVTLVAMLTTVWILRRVLDDSSSRRTAAVVALVGLSMVHGLAVLHLSDPTWRTEQVRGRYMRGVGYFPDAALPITGVLVHPPASRAARHDTPNVLAFSWRGYLDGRFEMRDTTGPTYLGARVILYDPDLASFMARPWRAVIVPVAETTGTTLCEATKARLRASANEPRARSLRYAANDAVLSITLEEPSFVVENETYFEGWSAVVETRGRPSTHLTPTATCESLRTWRLREGTHTLRERYVTPLLAQSLRVAGVALGVYALGVAVVLLRRRRVARKPANEL